MATMNKQQKKLLMINSSKVAMAATNAAFAEHLGKLGNVDMQLIPPEAYSAIIYEAERLLKALNALKTVTEKQGREFSSRWQL